MAEITKLYLGNTQITDLTPIAGTTGITTLLLTNTNVADLSPVAGMTRLTTHYLRNTKVSDLTPIASMTWTTALDLDNSLVSDLRSLLPLTKLANLPELWGLTFRNTPATALDPKLAELSKIQGDWERTAKTFDYLRRIGDNWPPNRNNTPTDRPSMP